MVYVKTFNRSKFQCDSYSSVLEHRVIPRLFTYSSGVPPKCISRHNNNEKHNIIAYCEVNQILILDKSKC